MTDDPGTHYVAQIKVEKVVRRENKDRGSANFGKTTRDIVETVNLTIKGGTLERLKVKVSEHVSLLDEEDL